MPAAADDQAAARYWLDVLMAGRDRREKLAADVAAMVTPQDDRCGTAARFAVCGMVPQSS